MKMGINQSDIPKQLTMTRLRNMLGEEIKQLLLSVPCESYDTLEISFKLRNRTDGSTHEQSFTAKSEEGSKLWMEMYRQFLKRLPERTLKVLSSPTDQLNKLSSWLTLAN